jgi:DnaJ-class molecular chaperone
LAKAHHPDLNPGDAAAAERFKTISVANELLSDPKTRARFDAGEIDAAGQERAPRTTYRDYAESESGHRYGPGGPGSAEWSNADFSDIFGSIFGEGGGRGGGTKSRGRDALFSLSADFLAALNGATQRLTLPSGAVLDVKIPPGTTDGQVLRIRGQGDVARNGGPPGDALIEVHVGEHAFFKRDGRDVRLDLPVTLGEAVLGGPVQVPTPGGPVRMRIPAHSDTGVVLRLRGRGAPAHGDQGAGDLYATLRVVIGPPDPALETFLAGWARDVAFEPRKAMEVRP